ncbi:MAG: hypothetical protein JW776_00060 [Candidatus Lokiarchaeota archaeon]|nr:hypothetical protein [Candidatus Lokiarchaeota archaeon]
MEKIKKYLEKDGIRYLQRDEDLVIPYKIDKLKFHIIITKRVKWVVGTALIASFDEIPDGVRSELYKNLLHANYHLPEINYAIDLEGNVFCTVDMEHSVTNFESFCSEFYAIPNGIKFFLEKIAPPLKLKLSGQE